MRLPRRRTLWLSAALLLVVVVGAWLLVPRTRLTQENFERIHDRMSKTEVRAILGENDQAFPGEMWEARMWQDGGPNWIVVNFDKETGKSCGAIPFSFSTWYTLKWYAKKGAAKIGVKWD